MNVVKSESGVGAGDVEIGKMASELKLNATADAVVKINLQDVPVYSADTGWLSLDVDISSFTVVSGTVDYIALGQFAVRRI